MRVLINAVSAKMGGSATYMRNVSRWLAQIAPDDEFIIYLPAVTKDKLDRIELGSNLQLEYYPYSNTGGLKRLYFDQVVIPRLARKLKADVLFSSTGFGTCFKPCPEVLLIRNLAYFDKAFHQKYRELGRSLLRNSIRRWHSLLSIRWADLVLFPSNAMQTMVEEYIPLHNKSTTYIHYGFDHDAFAVQSTDQPEMIDQIAQWKKQGYAILLNVSTFSVQKNYETLAAALPSVFKAGHKVKVITTLSREITTDKAEYDALMEQLDTLEVRKHFITLGYTPYTQLHALYEAADLYIFPSFTESFGHSMVEAMASGVPVVASDTLINREVCGAVGTFFKTFDAEDCADKIIQVLINEEHRDQISNQSVARSKHFDWQDYSKQLLGVFQEASNVKGEMGSYASV